MALPSLLIFGPQTTWPLPSYFSQLRSNLLSEPRLARFTETLRTLPRFWQTLVEADPRLQNVPGSEILTFFENWIEDGEFSTGHQTPLAIISTPLTVVIHIVQYLHFLKDQKSTSGLTHSDIISHVQDGGVQGFCTGLLAAIAVATSHSEEDVVTFGAVALRLAVCTGAYVDLDGAYASPPSHYASLAVRWRPEASRDKVLDILMRYTEVSHGELVRSIFGIFMLIIVSGLCFRDLRSDQRDHYYARAGLQFTIPSANGERTDCETS